MSTQLERYRAAAAQFTDQQKQDDEIIGIILTGSMVHGTLDKHSDIDITMILRSDCDYRERGNTWIDGIEIEYFKNPPQQIRHYFQMERNSPHTAHMLTYGEVVYQNDPVIDELVTEAKTVWATQPPALRPPQIDISKYHIDDVLKDLADCEAKNDVMAATLTRSHLVDFCINIFCKHHRVFRAKAKRLQEQLEGIDSDFAEIVYLMLSGSGNWAENLPRLREYMAGLLGGERPREWVLRSKIEI